MRVVSLFVVCTLSQTSSVESMMFPKKGLTAALDTRISIPPHWSRVYFRHIIKTNNEVLRQIIHSQPYNYGEAVQPCLRTIYLWLQKLKIPTI